MHSGRPARGGPCSQECHSHQRRTHFRDYGKVQRRASEYIESDDPLQRKITGKTCRQVSPAQTNFAAFPRIRSTMSFLPGPQRDANTDFLYLLRFTKPARGLKIFLL